MSLLVAMSLFELEQDLLLNNEYDFVNGACLMKLLQNHSCDSSANQKFLDLTTPVLVEESDEIYEILTAATPKRFSNMVRTNSTSGLIKKQNGLNYSTGNHLKVMYQGRDILDLAGNLQQREFVQSPRRSAFPPNSNPSQKPITYKCPDCQFTLYCFD